MTQLVRQAIYTSAKTRRGSGYQIVSRSNGFSEPDLRELSAWGPSHDSLIDDSSSTTSYNFFQLPSGAHAISRTMPAGSEYSGRRGYQIYTQFLVLTDLHFRQFGCNAFEVISTAGRNSILSIEKEFAEVIEVVPLKAPSKMINEEILLRACRELGPQVIASLIRKVLENRLLGIVIGPYSNLAISAVINCLPLSQRLTVSFSTGLKHSSRRNYRLFAVPDSKLLQRRLTRSTQVEIVNLTDDTIFQTKQHDWESWIENVLIQQNFDELESLFVRVEANSCA